MSRTVSQKRADFALKFVREYAEQDLSDVAKMATHIQKTPIRILQNGLGQALAFLLADAEGKDRKPAGVLYGSLATWLCGRRDDAHPCRVYSDGSGDLIARVVQGDRAAYLRAQVEALELFTWLKKFADAYLPTPSRAERPAGAR